MDAPTNDQELEVDLTIDQNALDVECLNQAKIFMKWSRRYTDARKERDVAKRLTTIIRAEMSQAVRIAPSEYGLEKVTEGGVQNVVESCKQVSDADNSLIENQRNTNLLESAKDSMYQRKEMLQELVKLYLSDYWADPRVSSKSVTKLADEGTANQKALLKKRMT